MSDSEVVPAYGFLVVATEWDSAHGGISTFNREFCAALAKCEHHVYCAVIKFTSEEFEHARALKVTLISPDAPIEDELSDIEILSLPLAGIEKTIDFIVGHARITGPAALAQKNSRYADASYVHIIHMDPAQIELEKNPEGAVVRGLARVNEEVSLAKESILAVPVGPELFGAYQYHLHEGTQRHEFLPGLFSIDSDAPTPKTPSCLAFGRGEDFRLKGFDIAAEAVGLAASERRERSDRR